MPMIPCPGAAHSNPYIDNCGICAPRWGEIEGPTDAELKALSANAAEAGDLDQVVLCDQALSGDVRALGLCAWTLKNAKAMEDT